MIDNKRLNYGTESGTAVGLWDWQFHCLSLVPGFVPQVSGLFSCVVRIVPAFGCVGHTSYRLSKGDYQRPVGGASRDGSVMFLSRHSPERSQAGRLILRRRATAIASPTPSQLPRASQEMINRERHPPA